MESENANYVNQLESFREDLTSMAVRNGLVISSHIYVYVIIHTVF